MKPLSRVGVCLIILSVTISCAQKSYVLTDSQNAAPASASNRESTQATQKPKIEAMGHILPTFTPAPIQSPTPMPSETATPANTPTATETPTPTTEQKLAVFNAQLQTAWSNGNWDDVITSLQGILAINKNDSQAKDKLYAAYVNRGQTLAQAGKNTDAVSDFQKALAINPNGGEASAGLIQLTPTAVPTPTPKFSDAQKAKVQEILLASVTHYENILNAGKQVLGSTRYSDAWAGNDAMLNPSSAASRFRDWRKQIAIERDTNLEDAFENAVNSFPDSVPSELETWQDDMDDARSALIDWMYDSAEWQINTMSNAQFLQSEQKVRTLLTKAKNDAASVMNY